jgi:hypothetical protein
MRAEVWKGQLTMVDTKENEITILDHDGNQPGGFNIDENTKIGSGMSYEDLIGEEVEIIIIGDKVTYIRLIEQ